MADKHGEAPSSANCRIKTKSGYVWQITVRSDKVSDLLKKIDTLQQKFIKQEWMAMNGIKPAVVMPKSQPSAVQQQQPQQAQPERPQPTSGPQPETRFCNMHGAVMVSAVSKKTGKPYFSHRNEQGQMCFGGGYN